MNYDLAPKAIKSLEAALRAYPSNARTLLSALQEGHIDGQEHNAVLHYLSEDDDITEVASGQNNNRLDLPPVEAFVLGVRPTIDTTETCEELQALEEVVQRFVNNLQDELGDLRHEGWADTH